MMKYPVIYDGQEIGSCQLTEEGLYWSLECTCTVISDKAKHQTENHNILYIHCLHLLRKDKPPD